MSVLSENELFASILEGTENIVAVDPYRCGRCATGNFVETDANRLVCDSCGMEKEGMGQIGENDQPTTSVVSISLGGGKSRTYNVSTSNVETRANTILAELDELSRKYTSVHGQEAVPRAIRIAVARKYAMIQESFPEKGGGKFIRRGDVRGSIIAALLNNEMTEGKNGRKKETISDFMDLKKAGFSSGENALREIESLGIITISSNVSTEGFVERYLDRLKINKPAYAGFVSSVVQYSIDYNISMRSQLSSKVAGAIWLLLQSINSRISIERLETASDKTRANTIKNFFNSLRTNIDKFYPLYTHYDIPCLKH